MRVEHEPVMPEKRHQSKTFYVMTTVLLSMVFWKPALSEKQRPDSHVPVLTCDHYLSRQTTLLDEDDVLRYCREAADSGSKDAQFELGLMYLDGIGVEQDEDQALEWLARASRQGHERATQVMEFVFNGDYFELGC